MQINVITHLRFVAVLAFWFKLVLSLANLILVQPHFGEGLALGT